MKTLALFLSLCLAGCGSITYRSVYEGIRSKEKAQGVGSSGPVKALPGYDQYEKERTRLAPERP